MTDTERSTASHTPGPLNDWIEREFAGHGRAIREQHESPYPDEPYMSMADAKELTRRAVAEFAPDMKAENERLREQIQEALFFLENVTPAMRIANAVAALRTRSEANE